MHSVYADDANIYSPVDPTTLGDCAAVAAANRLTEWYIRNGMLPNPDKSVAVLVGTV